MRSALARSFVLIAVCAAAAAPAQVPATRALQGFQPGQWQVKPLGNGGEAQTQCLPDAELMLTGKRPAAQCAFTVITDSEDAAVVTYRCAGGRSGRTAIRRDVAGLYTVDAQGLESALPFADRSEWRRTGNC